MHEKSESSIPTIDDVARDAGVSTATVSRCLNTPERVQAQTRERVLQAVHRLGYTPNFGARALVARRTNTVGAVIPTMDNAIFARGLQAFQEALRESGVTLLVATSQYHEDVEEDQIRTLIARGVDGILLIGYQRRHDIYLELERRGIATVIAWAYDPAVHLPAVGFDNRRSMAALADAVLDHGHREIGFISADTASNDRARERLIAVREAMAARGLDPDRLQVIETVYSIEAGARALRALMSRRPRPTVVMCGNDVLAVGALGEARRLGLAVPRDLSVTGFDDIELASVAEPALTTVHVPHRQMGQRAARALLDQIRLGHVTGACELETGLRIRASLGPAPAS